MEIIKIASNSWLPRFVSSLEPLAVSWHDFSSSGRCAYRNVLLYVYTSKYALHEKNACALRPRVLYNYLSGQKAIFCLVCPNRSLAVVYILYIHGFGVPLALLLWYIHPWIRSAP